MVTLLNTAVIADNKKKIYISEGYKPTKKNKVPMQKEVDKLNKKEPGRYALEYAFMGKGYELQTFNCFKY